MDNPTWELILLSGILGILTGSFLSITFFRLENVWKRLIYSMLIGGAPIPGLLILFNNFSTNNVLKIWCYIAFLTIMIISFITVLIFLLKRLKVTYGETLEIRDTDILLGYKNAITDYYAERQKQADLNIQLLQKKKEELVGWELELKKRKTLLNEEIDSFDTQMKDAVKIVFPENFPVPITNTFINGIPNRAKQFQRFAFYSSILADDLGKKYMELSSKDTEYNSSLAATKLREFARGICNYTTLYLFSNDIRTHFRYLFQNKVYKGLVTSFDDEGHIHQITPIPVNQNNLINHSAKISRSLIRNFNNEHDYNSNSKRWINYLTIALTDHVFLNEEHKPIISMGISIPDNDSFEEMLRFLNFIGFERIIEQTFLQFNRYVDCKKAINYLSSQP